MNKPITKAYAAREFLHKYIRENGIKDICNLFDKKMLIKNTYKIEWQWHIEDEIFLYGYSKEKAIEKTKAWFDSMSNEELFYRRISSWNQKSLIVKKAEELGLEWRE